MRRCISTALAVLVLLLVPIRAQGQYVLMNGTAGNGIVRMWNMDSRGRLTFRSSWDIWTSTTAFADPRAIIVSRKGNYAFISEIDGQNGAVYRIAPDYSFHIVDDLTSGCGGGGFSYDERYFFTLTNEVTRADGPPRMKVYDLHIPGEGGAVVDNTVATTAGLTFKYVCTSRGEILGSALNGLLGVPAAFASYRFDPEAKTLALTQYIPGVNIYRTAAGISEDLVAYTRNDTLGILVRDPDGTWRNNYQWTRPVTYRGDWAGNPGLGFTPDGRYLVMAIEASYSLSDSIGGLGLFRVTPDKKLDLIYHIPRYMVYEMAMTPDGKYVAVAYDDDKPTKKLGVFYIDEQNQAIAEVFTMDWPYGWVAGMAFLPQAFPTNSADKSWGAYSEKTAPVGTRPPTARIAKAVSLPDTPSPTFASVPLSSLCSLR